EEERNVEPAVRGQYPPSVALRGFRLELPQHVSSVEIARLERAVEHTDVDRVAGHRRRRKHIGLALLPDELLAGLGIQHEIEAGIRRAEDSLSSHYRGRAHHPASGGVET